MCPTNNPKLTSWVDVSPECEFPIQNLPYGVFQLGDAPPAVGVAIGEFVLDLAALHASGKFSGTSIAADNIFAAASLNGFMGKGRQAWTDVRDRISELLRKNNATIRDDKELRQQVLIPSSDVRMLMPVAIGDFTDFYSSKHHATNVGTMFRDASNPLLPNWLHLPVGYHGRSGTVFVSGVDIHRPNGQLKPDDNAPPIFGPSRLLDFELEIGFIVGAPNEAGHRIEINQAAQHIFGMVLVNDWSARDIQKWEYVPLGPFLGKSFATSISPWVVTLDALEPFRVPSPVQEPDVLPYLKTAAPWGLDIRLEAFVQSAKMSEPMKLTSTNFKHMYWTIVQQLAHHTVNGTAMRVGDLCGSGTVSGPTEDARGCMLEICWKGTKPITLPDGDQRRFFADGDTVTLRGASHGEGYRIGFGEVSATILPAVS